MAENVGLIRLFAFIFGFCGLIFLIASTSTHHWKTMTSKTNHRVNSGIFESCQIASDGFYSCEHNAKSAWLNVVKTFMILSIILHLFVVIYLIIMVWGRGMTIKLIGIDLIFAALFGLIAMCVYTGKANMSGGYEYSWSYALGWTATCCSIISAVLCFFADVDYEQMK